MRKNIELQTDNYIELEYKDDVKRDVMLILPGGGYQYTSEREARPVAKKFRKENFHTAIYYYRESILAHPHLINEVKEALNHLKKDVLINRIFVIGFSAGGHFALHSLITYPNIISGGILSYPVISCDNDSIHKGSFETLTGSKSPIDFEKVSLEKLINQPIPPIFIWHTKDDEIVPVSNVYKLREVLEKYHSPYELLLFEKGEHGLSVANREVAPDQINKDEYFNKHKEIRTWFAKAVKFIQKID